MVTVRIVGYSFNADVYCPDHVIDALPTGEGGAFDGWALAPGVFMGVEDNLDQIAEAFVIHRGDETTFDSGDFPKAVFSDASDVLDLQCGTCGEDLVDGNV